MHENAVIPTYAKDGDCGLDLTAVTKSEVDNGTYGYVEFDTCLQFEIPRGYAGFLFPRSSISKTGHLLSNAVGVIDSGYRGNVTMRFKTVAGSDQYKIGDRIGQLVILPYPEIEFEEVENLAESVRGSGGYGSSGK